MKNYCLTFAVAFILLFSSPTILFSQSGGESLFRTSGYKGSVSYTNQLLVWSGIDTSHGYLFGEHHYLGAGAGFFIGTVTEAPMFGRLFADYKAYILKKNSTPVAGISVGGIFAIKQLSGNLFLNAVELNPRIGWNWAKENHSWDLSLGASLFVFNNQEDGLSSVVMPKIAFGIEF